jgi:deazaflavin-dependent oxidoreductase (nitroreductase family)
MDLRAVTTKSTVLLTTTGRKTGQLRRVKVWFVVDGPTRLLVQHVRGDEANWYRNLLENSEVSVDFGGGALAARARPILERPAIEDVLARIRRKYFLAWFLHAFGRSKAVAAAIELI